MSLWKRLFKHTRPAETRPDAAPPEQHAVTIAITIPAGHPSKENWDWAFALQEQIKNALTESGKGELDGDLWGRGECIIYCYGTNAQAMWEAIMPVLEPHPIPKGSYAIKRFGAPGQGREERVDIGWDG